MNRNDAEAVIKDTIEYANSEINKTKRRNRKFVIATAVFAFLVIALASSFVSYVKFDTANPFAVASGCFQIVVLDKEYVEIQSSPRVILAQPSDKIFVDYIADHGFTEKDRMGSMRYFTNGDTKEAIWYIMNGHYAKWSWQ